MAGAAGKTVQLPPEENGRPSPIANFFHRVGGVLGRGRSPGRRGGKPPKADTPEKKSKASSKSPVRVFGSTLARLSMRRKDRLSTNEDDGATGSSPMRGVISSPHCPPRPAISENDLRNITIQRGYNEMPITPLVGTHTYMSEDNLASADCGAPAYRTPSYIRISCALNGYRSPSRGPAGRIPLERSAASADSPPIYSTPARVSAQNPSIMARSLVERRLDQLRQAACPSTPHSASCTPDPHATRRGAATVPCTPDPSASAAMGNVSCTPTPVKNLISQFDRLHLCSSEEEQKENVKPHSLIINEQPIGEKKEKRKESREEEEKEMRIRLEQRIDGETAPEEEVNHNIIKPVVENGADAATNKEQSEVRDGTFFLNLLASTRSSLLSSAESAEKELNSIQGSVNEGACAVLRLAIGKAKLLNGKKLDKFESLIQKNLHPIPGDPQPAMVDDLEGFWGLVEIELQDVESSFAHVAEWRRRGWEEPPLEETISNGSSSGRSADSGRGTHDGSARTASGGGGKATKPAVNAEKMKADAERRRAQMAEAKARMKAKQNGKSEIGGGMMIL